MTLTANAVYMIKSVKHPSYSLNVYGTNGSFSEGATVNLYATDSSDTHQHWRLLSQDGNLFRLASAANDGSIAKTSFVLTRNNSSTIASRNTTASNNNQRLYFSNISGKQFTIALSDGKLLTAASTAGSVSWNSPYDESSSNFSHQLWELTLVETPTYRGTTCSSSTALGTKMGAFSTSKSQPKDSTSTGHWPNTNPFPSTLNSSNSNKHWCTWYAWGRMFERKKKAISTSGDAGNWYANAQTVNQVSRYASSSTPQVGIAVFSNSAEGHVVFVEYYNSSTSTVYYSEANASSADGILKSTSLTNFKKLYGNTLMGYLI